VEEIPAQIGPYKVLEPLGAGGMGEVLLAHDERLDRKVAIKRIRRGTASPDQRERFRREARLAARLNHSAIVQVYDLVTEGDVDNLVMEYVEGNNLRVLSRQGPLPVCEVLDLGIQIAQGLREAHRHGIVHRDLKTENVLVTPEGRAKIADFGVAKRLADAWVEESLTRTDAIVGTYRTMSPEQARGGPVDHRSDLFALGVLLYELLAGESPFHGENPLATLDQIIHHRQTPVREVNPAVPRELSRLVDRLLEKEPALRPRSAGEVLKCLEEISGARVEETGTATLVEVPAARQVQVPEAVVKRRSRPLLIPGLLLAVLLAVGGYLALRPPAPPVYVAVLPPQVGSGAGSGEVELLASGARVALLQALLTLEGISPQAFEEVDDVAGSPREVARAVAAQELVGARLDCRPEVCRIALTRLRGADGSVIWAESFDVPADDSAVVASAVRTRLRQGYSDYDTREGAADPVVSERDLDELLLLRQKYKARQEPSDAILAELAAIRQRSPRFLEVHLLEADFLGRRFWASRDPKDFDLALARIEEARKLEPSDPRALLERVDLALRARRLDLAERSIAELETLIPGDARLLEWQAHLLSAEGHGAEALDLMRSAAHLHPSSQRLRNLAKMEFEQGQIDGARKTLDLLLDRSPGNLAGLSLLAQIEVSSGNFQRAIELYDELVRRSPGLTNLSALGLAYFFLGRYSEAAATFRRALDLQPDYPGLVLNLADSYLLLGRNAEAEALYLRLVELIEADPAASDPQLLTNKAQALAHLGRGRQAVAALQDALRVAPDNGFVAYEASLVYALLGEEDSALVNVERAVRQGIGERWFSRPWFASLRKRRELNELLRQARPGLG
jgi:serine/threonine-protein kinase